MSLSVEREFYSKLKSEVTQFQHFAKHNMGLLLTLLYLMGSLAGVVYLSILLHQFDTNIFFHMELTDYLSAILTSGRIMLSFLGYIIGMSVVLIWRIKRIPPVRKNTRFNRLWCRLIQPFHMVPPLSSTIGFSYLALILYSVMAGVTDAERIVENKANHYNVVLNYPINLEEQSKTELHNVSIVAASSSNLFVFDQASKALIILPQANLSALFPLPKKAKPEIVIPSDKQG